MNAAGLDYIGHTDMLADLTGSKAGCMMLSHGSLNVTHVCTHVPLADVPGRITPERVHRVIELTLAAMRDLGIPDPTIAVCGLNPHSGEAGLMGKEEATVIEPA